MDGHHVSIDTVDEIWVQRRARLKALDSVNKSLRQAEFKRHVNPLVRKAVKEGDVDKFIEALEKYSAEERVSLSDIIDIRGPSGNSLLHIAAGIENADILRALLEVIPDKQLAAKENYRGDTALHLATKARRIRSAKLLLGCGRIVHMVNDAGNTALHEAVKNVDLELTGVLLSQGSRAVYPKNKESKCPLYLAVETKNLEILELLMQAMDENEVPWSRMQGMSPVHGAVMHKNSEMLEKMSEQKELFDLRDAGGRTPLHLAIYVNYVVGVEFLVDKFASSAFEVDDEGYLPIHVACKMGHCKIMKLLLHWLDPEELLTLKEGQNILHVAAKYGRTSIVNYILFNHSHEKLINVKDKEGNTPLHVATLERQQEVVFYLVTCKKVNVDLVNNSNLTALDIVDERKVLDDPFHEAMIKTLLKRRRASRSKDKAICQPKSLGPERFQNPQHLDRLRNMANTYMVVATLIVTMTFAAGFSVPGGYKDSEPDAGIAILLNKPMYDVFVICNMVSMYSSMIAVVILLRAQIISTSSVAWAVDKSTLMLFIALITMPVAFMAGIYVTVSKRNLIASITLAVGITALYGILSPYIATFFWIRINWAAIGHSLHEFIGVFISKTKSGTAGRAKRPARWAN